MRESPTSLGAVPLSEAQAIWLGVDPTTPFNCELRYD